MHGFHPAVVLAGALTLLSAPVLADSPPAKAATGSKAPTKQECVAANTKGQDLRREGKLSAARDEFRSCSVVSCPALLRDDCTVRLDEVERVQPTIVFDAKNAAGEDVSSARVTVDGTTLTERLTGAPLQVDPGEHVFTFEVAGQAPVARTFVIKEGDKDRKERVLIGPPPPAPPVTTPPAALANSPSSHPGASASGGMGTQKILGLTSAGLGVAGVVVGGVFGLLSSSQESRQKTDCASPTSCPNHANALSDHSAAVTDGTLSTVAFIAGGALLTVGGVLFFAGTGGHSAEPAATRLVIAPSVGAGGGGMLLKGAF